MARTELAPEARGSYVELIPDQLYALGGAIPLDGQASWAPSTAAGFQPLNCYLIRGASDILVDTGIGCVREEVMEGLQLILREGAPISIFMTRALMDCVGSLGLIVDRYEVRDIFTGGRPNPFDQFEATSATKMGVHRSPVDPPIEVFPTTLKLLATYWGYDAATRTAFTSDSFAHTTVADPRRRPVIDSLDADLSTEADVRAHIDTAFWWLKYADNRNLIAENIRSFFESHPVEIIAPTRGCVLVGEEVVERHVEMVLDAISQ